MKKIIKKFWWVAALLVTLCSLFFGVTTHIVNVRLDNEIAIVQEENEKLEQQNAEFQATLQEKDAKLEELMQEVETLKKSSK